VTILLQPGKHSTIKASIKGRPDLSVRADTGDIPEAAGHMGNSWTADAFADFRI
jgi:hypothetical protein